MSAASKRRGPPERPPRRPRGHYTFLDRLPLAALLGSPFTDNLQRCEERWAKLLAGARFVDARLKPAL